MNNGKSSSKFARRYDQQPLRVLPAGAIAAISHKFRSRGAANGLGCEARRRFSTGAV